MVIVVRYNILGYLIGEGFGNVFKNKKSTGASVIIMCATMLIFRILFSNIRKHQSFCSTNRRRPRNTSIC